MSINDEILEKAKILVRQTLSDDDSALLAEKCIQAGDELSARLKDDVTAQSVQACFVRAAAALAVALYIETDTRQFDGFSAGAVSVTGRDPRQTKEAADALRRQAELMMIGFLKDRGFCFKAVKG